MVLPLNKLNTRAIIQNGKGKAEKETNSASVVLHFALHIPDAGAAPLGERHREGVVVGGPVLIFPLVNLLHVDGQFKWVR